MENYELYHHGILGMKWGVRRTPAQLGHAPTGARKTKDKARAITDEANERIKKIKAQGRAESRVTKAEERAAARIAKAEAKYLPKKKSGSESNTKSLSEMSDEELNAKINRITLEKKYRELATPRNAQSMAKGKKFVMDVLEASGKNIATQAVTYAMGRGANKLLESVFGEANAINPKKGQKDK